MAEPIEVEIVLPIKGESQIMPHDKPEDGTSGYLLNVRPVDVLEKRIRLGKRPGFKKAYSDQLTGNTPILAICSVTTID